MLRHCSNMIVREPPKYELLQFLEALVKLLSPHALVKHSLLMTTLNAVIQCLK